MAGQGAPNLVSTEEIITTDVFIRTERGIMLPARPLGWQGIALRKRLKLAWGVFRGRYDALVWTEK